MIKQRKVKDKNCHAKTYTMLNPDGEEVTFTNMKAFCKDSDLGVDSLGKVYRGEQREHKGWKSTGVGIVFTFNEEKPKTKAKYYEFYNPQGERVKFTGMRKFCKENNLPYQKMFQVDKRVIPECQGWKKYDANDYFKVVMRA